MTVYLIDGYNVLYELRGQGAPGRQAGEAGGGSRRGAGPGRRDREGAHQHPADLEDERRRLLDRIASYMGGTTDKAIVVFDARTAALQKVESATANVDVYFGSFSRSADTIIERETYALSAAKDVVVVTSDYNLQKTVFLSNVTRRSSRQFVGDLMDHTKKVAISENCITMRHRVEEKIDSGTLERLKALRERLAGGAQGPTREEPGGRSGRGSE